MAVISNQKPILTQNKDKQPAPITPNQPVVLGGGAAPIIGAEESQPGPGGAASPSKSGRFTNLQSYLNANKGYNAEGGGMAGNIAGALKKEGDNVLQSGQNAYSNITTQARQNTQPSTSYTTPTDYSKLDTNSLANLQATLAGTSTGYDQNSIASAFTPAQANLQELQTHVGMTGNEQGRLALLPSLFGQSGNYGRGNQLLDNLILQGSPEQLGALANLGSIPTNTSNSLGALQTSAGSDITSIQKLADDATKKANLDLNAAANAMYNPISTSLNKAQTHQTELQNAFGALQSNTATPEQLKLLGISGISAGKYAVNPSNFLQLSATPTLQSVITPEQQAQLTGLSSLSSYLSPEVQSALANLQGNTQAGTYSSGTNFNNQGFSNALSAAQKSNPAYQSAVSDAIKGYDSTGKDHPGLSSVSSMISQGLMPANLVSNDKTPEQNIDSIKKYRDEAGYGTSQYYAANALINVLSPFTVSGTPSNLAEDVYNSTGGTQVLQTPKIDTNKIFGTGSNMGSVSSGPGRSTDNTPKKGSVKKKFQGLI